jgi:hypothetical protein
VKFHRAGFLYFPILLVLAPSLQAGTQVKAFLQSLSGQADWVNAQVSIQQGQMRVDWKGPRTKGALLYDRETSQVSLVDPFHKSVFVLPATDQTTLKVVLALFAGQLRKQADGADPSTRSTLELMAKNARAFFNGTPQLEKKGDPAGGFPCDTYLTRDPKGFRMREVWVTPAQGTGMGDEDYNTFRSLAHLSMDLTGSLLGQWGADTESFEQNFSGSDLPVQEVVYVKARPSLKFKILGVQARDFGPETFQLPGGYKTLGLLDLLRQSSGN